MKYRYKYLMEFTTEGIIIIDSKGLILDANNSAAHMFGYSVQGFRGTHIKELLGTNTDYQSELCLQDGGMKPCIFEKTLFKNDGTKLEVEITSKHLSKEYVIFVHDVTERIKNIKTLKQIAWLQSHEVRPPVANILGIVNLIDLDNGSRDLNKKLIAYLKSSARKLDSIIRDIVQKSIKVDYFK